MEHRDVYLNFISGQWKQGSSGQWDENRNPAKPSEILGKATRSTGLDAERAIDAAQKAQTTWARLPRPQRGAILLKTAAVLKGKIENFAKTVTREEGKNLGESRAEIQKSVQALEFLGSESRRPVGETFPSDIPGTFIQTTRSALGVVAIITPYSLPVYAPALKIGSALLEGNAVVFKPSTVTPASAALLVRAFEEAGLPAGLLNLVYGSGAVVGTVLAQDKRIRAISFTGSNDIGKEINVQAARNLTRVQLELGAKNAVVVLADADLDLAVEATVIGAFSSAGQRCTATSRVIVDQSIHAAFTQKLIDRTRSLKVGDGLADPTAMGPLAEEKHLKATLEAIDIAKKEGAQLVLGGERVSATGPDSGYFLSPTIFDGVKAEMRIAREDLCAPVLVVIPVAGAEEATKAANATEFGLSTSIFGRDISQILRCAEQIDAGTVHVNSPTLGGETQAPSGGMKHSGLGGREGGALGTTFFCEMKTIYIDSSGQTRPAHQY